VRPIQNYTSYWLENHQNAICCHSNESFEVWGSSLLFMKKDKGSSIAVGLRMFLGMQDFDFVLINPTNLLKFEAKYLIEFVQLESL